MSPGSAEGRSQSAARLRAVWMTAVCVAAGVGPAHADGGLDEIVVSARKRSELAQDVPISLSEISGPELQRRSLVRVQDFVREMANVSTDILSARQASLAIRGLGRNPANEALEPSVGVFLDGVYLGRPGMMITDLADLERIEVLRGPQGALFGKNATAGVLNIITASPSAVPEGWLEVSAGDYRLRELRGAASGPIGSAPWAWRLSGFATAREGFIHDTGRDEWLGELQRAGGRAQLQWAPGDASTVRLIADYASQDESGPGYLLVDPNYFREDGTVRPTNLVTRAARFGYTPEFAPEARRNDADAEQRTVTENVGATLLADLDLGRHRLSSITGGRKFRFRPENDGDYSALDVLPALGTNVLSRQFSQELRLASPAEGSFQYLAGLQYFEQQVRSGVFAKYGSDASEYLFPGLAADALDGFAVLTDADPGTHSYSVFGQTYWWPVKDLEIAAGIRWTTEDKAATVAQRTDDSAASSARADPAALQARQRLGSAQRFDVRSSEDFLSGSISVSWHFADGMSAYLSAARGAKSGGVNAAILPAGADLTIDPEIALGYELGLKTLWREDRLKVNASVFDTRIDGYQASIRDRVIGASYLANAGTVRSRGFELEAAYRPLSSLTLTGAVGYNDAHYESFRSAPCPPELDDLPSCDFSGERVAGAPPRTYSASAEHVRALRSGAYRVRTRIEYSHTAEYRAELSRSTRVADYDLVNLRASIGTADEHRSLAFWVLNLFDEYYYSGIGLAGPANTGVSLAIPGAPRTFGLSLQWRY